MIASILLDIFRMLSDASRRNFCYDRMIHGWFRGQTL